MPLTGCNLESDLDSAGRVRLSARFFKALAAILLGWRAPPPLLWCAPPGGVAEWFKAHAWKVCIRETVSRVRIPLPPPTTPANYSPAG